MFGRYWQAWTITIASASVAAFAAAPGVAAAQPAPAVRHVELMTVTDTAAVWTWEQDAETPVVIRYGTAPDALDHTCRSTDPQRRFVWHELAGLHPGTEYHYAIVSTDPGDANEPGQRTARTAGASAPDDGPWATGRFKTLIPPPGEELFAFAALTDTHVGEQQAGRVQLGPDRVLSEGAIWRDPAVPFWQLALEGAIADINAADVAFTVIKGDITDGLTDAEFPAAKRLLDGLAQTCHPVCGNHDRQAAFQRTFGLEQTWYSFDRNGIHFLVLDSESLGPRSLDTQTAWIAKDLAAHRGRPTFVFIHRPIPPEVSRGSSGRLADELFEMKLDAAKKYFGPRAARYLQSSRGRTPNIPVDSARRLAALFREHGKVAGVFAGHLHRNYIGTWPEETGNLPYIESAATKEHPVGYTITRVYDGGYMHNFYPARDERCLEWSATTRDVYARIGYPDKAGSLADRSFVLRFDDLDLTAQSP